MQCDMNMWRIPCGNLKTNYHHMKIKVKLTLGVGLLFLFIALLAVLGGVYINAINKDTQNILVANYNTLDYSRSMLIALDEDITSKASLKKFSENFQKVKSNPYDSLIYISIRKDLTNIMLLNMQAIQRKSNVAKQTANNAIWVIALTGTLCFIIAFTLLINLPGNIANPIKELTESIKQIAEKNYEQRVHFEGHNEFGELATSFNSMAQKLEEFNKSNLSKIMFEKKR